MLFLSAINKLFVTVIAISNGSSNCPLKLPLEPTLYLYTRSRLNTKIRWFNVSHTNISPYVEHAIAFGQFNVSYSNSPSPPDSSCFIILSLQKFLIKKTSFIASRDKKKCNNTLSN